MRSRGLATIAAALAALLVGGAATTAGAGTDDRNGAALAEVRRATAPFQRLAEAENAGYTAFADCFDSSEGGMGQHYVSQSLLDDEGGVSADTPEALVYEVRDHTLKLVGVEYIVYQADVSGPPSLFGHAFHEFGPFYVLHAWVWRDNPTDVFADWNPKVAPCP